MSLFSLQVSFFKQDNPMDGMAFLVFIGIVLVVIILTGVIRQNLGAGGGSSKGSGSGGRRFSIFALHRAARLYGLNRDQTKLLEYVFKRNGVTDPERTITNPQALDKHFKRAFKEIETGAGSEEEAQQKLALLFLVRNTIDMRHNTSSGGTERISSGMSAVLTANQESHQVKVISSKENAVLVDCPRNPGGAQIHIPKGTKVNLAFFTKNSKGFSIDSQVLGMGETSYGPALQLSYTGHTKAMTARRFRRTQAVLSCNYYIVRLEAQHKKPPKMIVEPRSIPGSVSDISIGGCAIKTKFPVPVGSRLKIEFDYSRSASTVAVLGQVLRTNRSGIANTILHIKFLKVPRKAMNAVNVLVFEYGD